jgi:valyl-tRNA synthetase
VTEEAWSWWQEGSVHRASWPDPAGLRARAGDADPRLLDAASAAIAAVRAAKSAARLSMRAPVRQLVVSAGEDDVARIRAVLGDVQAAGKVDQVVVRPSASPQPVHHVTL